MRKTYTDFSQLSRGMFRKSDPVVEVKPIPKKNAGGEDALAYFGLNAPEAPTRAPGGGLDNGRIQSLEANVAALRAESAALGAAKAEAERKSADLERQLAAERQMRASAGAERDRLRGEILRLKNELEDALTAPSAGNGERGTGNREVVREVKIIGLLKTPATIEVFPGEVRGHILAVLSEGLEAAQSSERERRAKVLEDVLAANKPGSELERRRRELKQIIKDTGSFVDARTIAALEKIGFKCVSGNKHWKLDYANVRIPISKTPSDRRAALNTATDIANRCF
ncbi:MAG: hypothetical protein II840_03150 [Kiritimatiellae bacterium]|nr:hypothetical protein [Kiritimatiellia bacterium]